MATMARRLGTTVIFALLAASLMACGQAGSKLATAALDAAVKTAFAPGRPAQGNAGTPTPRCPAACPKGEVCDADSGACVTEEKAAAFARARREVAERPPYEVPPDPCGGRCREQERCERRAEAFVCVTPPEE